MTWIFQAYQRFTRWIASISRALVACVVFTTDELGRRMAEAGRRAQEFE